MPPQGSLSMTRAQLGLLWLALGLALGVGILGRGYWTPDEPREADIAWRMSWQSGKAVPLLAGEAFCEKPPLSYWVSGAAIDAFGPAAWAARLPNLVYALITALAVGALGRRSAGSIAGLTAAAAVSTLLLSYQVAIWLATDAALLATGAASLLGLSIGFYAGSTGERLRGYSCMHAALALGFLCKSAAGWMVPALTLITLILWEKRWRELLRWELYAGVLIQGALILPWVWFVYVGADGPEHLKVFFWNNLAGRFTHVAAPQALQYTAAHQNSPGKYLIELPVYLWPWTLLVIAAGRRAWRQRSGSAEAYRPVRFALATFLPTLLILSLAATARNIYLAPAFPGVALLLGWWASTLPAGGDAWDSRAVRATAVLLMLAAVILGAAVWITGRDSGDAWGSGPLLGTVAAVGLGIAAVGAAYACRRAGRSGLLAARPASRGDLLAALPALLFAYCALLIGPAAQIYSRVDTWQDLALIGRAIGRDSVGRPLILFAPDETTRALVDLYARRSVYLIPAPATPLSAVSLNERLAVAPDSLVVAQMPGANPSRTLRDAALRLGLARFVPPSKSDSDAAPVWAVGAHLRLLQIYALPNGRRYALFGGPANASR
jgi:4-amino-4-deoxy-L-arabinose transferase-like glycosyltransferase